jgi:hypothetical protein
MTELMRVVRQGDAFVYGLIHELNQSKEIRLETRPGVWPETVYSGFEGWVSILKDHTVREEFWEFSRTNHDDSLGVHFDDERTLDGFVANTFGMV